MSSPKDLHFVRGELAPGRLSLATGQDGEGRGSLGGPEGVEAG